MANELMFIAGVAIGCSLKEASDLVDWGEEDLLGGDKFTWQNGYLFINPVIVHGWDFETDETDPKDIVEYYKELQKLTGKHPAFVISRAPDFI